MSEIYIGGFVNHPAALAQVLVDVGQTAQSTTVMAALPSGLRTPLKQWRNGRVVLTHATDGFEEAIAAGRAAFRPTHLSELAAHLRAARPRMTFVRVTPPDTEGRCHLGFSVDTTLDAIRGGQLVVAEVDPTLPRAAGNAWIHADDIFLAIDAAPLPPRAAERAANESSVEDEVARRVAELIPDRAAVELGMGHLPDVIASALHDHRHLRLHTGIVTEAVLRLLEAGAVDESPPTPFLAPVVAIMGTNDAPVRAALNDDPRIELHPVSTTHNRCLLASLPDFHAVNGALSVALDGSVNSEYSGSRRVAAVGGLMDFREGARLSDGGKFIIALTSNRPSGQSRIVPTLEQPATVPTADAGWVVTEYGAVDLGPLDLKQRAEALIELAHPDHRDELAASSAR
jgi:acyl-CoA hydrolase